MIAYHFTTTTLRDGSPIPPIGHTLGHTGPVTPCESGLHASEHPFDALTYAPGPILHRVELTGGLIAHGDPPDKHVGRERTILATLDAGSLLYTFARQCAMDVAHLWDAPPAALHYLRTGDPESRCVADSAAHYAAEQAARCAAYLACSAADSACSASYSAIYSASYSAIYSASYICSAAHSAARLAAHSAVCSAAHSAVCSAAYSAADSAADSARSAQRIRLLHMVEGAFAYQLENATPTP